MSIDLQTAYIRTGLPKTPENDLVLTMAINFTLAMLENYLDRKFMYDAQSETFIHTHNRSIQVQRYPLDTIISMTPPLKHHVHHTNGILVFEAVQFEHTVTVEYSGGYKSLPADLEMAFWICFDGGLTFVIGTGGTTATAGEVSSVTIADVGTVRFTTTADAIKAASSASPASGSGIITPTALFLLEPYRRYKS